MKTIRDWSERKAMTFLEWSPDFEVGSPVMDEQHRQLLEIVNRFHDAVARKAPRGEIVAIFEEAADFSRYHFRDEESLMARHGYPALDQHRMQHRHLVDRVTELLLLLRGGQEGAAEQIQYFLKGWLTAHIKGIDRQYRPFAQAKAA